VLPPDGAAPTLVLRVESDVPVHVNELSATDACALRGYENPRRLSNGLFLYENPSAAPRVYAVGSAVRADDLGAVRRALLDFRASDIGRKAVVGFPVPEDLRAGTVEHAVFGQRASEVVVTGEG